VTQQTSSPTTSAVRDGQRKLHWIHFRLRHEASHRMIVLLWTIYLTFAWLTLTGFRGQIDPGSLRLMLVASMVGLLTLWPALRLSQMRGYPSALNASGSVHAGLPITSLGRAIASELLTDWVCLVVVLQLVIWPIRLTAGWTGLQALWLTAVAMAWSLMAGAITAWGCRWDCKIHRTTAMLGCLALLVAEPLVMAWVNAGTARGSAIAWPMGISPFQMLWSLAGSPTEFDPRPWSDRVRAMALAAVVAWVALLVVPIRSDARKACTTERCETGDTSKPTD
jgi:hypothetical protein